MNSPKPRVTGTAPTVTGRSRGRLALYAAIVGAVLTSIVAYRQYSAPFTWHEPYPALRSASWYLHPIEWNIDAVLPDISAGVNAIAVLDGTVWIAGNGGFLAFSADAGRTWTPLPFDATERRFALPAGVSANVRPTTPSAAGNLGRLIVPRVYAAPAEVAAQAPAGNPSQRTGQAPPKASDSAQLVLKASVESLAFEQVTVGDTKSQLIKFSAVGVSQGRTSDKSPAALPAPPARPIFGDDAFSVTSASDCGSLDDGQNCNMFIAFAPKAAKGYYAVFRWANASITLAGLGVASAEKSPPTPESKTTPPTPKPPPGAAPPPQFVGFSSCEPQLCSVRSSSEEFVTRDQGATWTFARSLDSYADAGALPPPSSPRLPDGGAPKDFASESERGRQWTLATDGAIYRSDDSGKGWIPVTRAAAATIPGHIAATGRRYGRSLPPWYLLALALFALVIQSRRQSSRAEKPLTAPVGPRGDAVDDSAQIAGNHGTADKPLEPGQPDALGLSAIAAGLAFFLRNEDTKPPLVIAVNGRWGSGKSSLMNLLRGNLQKYGSRPVWFNAWHHQSEDQLLAGLLQAVKTEAVPPLWSRGGWSFRARLAVSRFERYWAHVALGLAALFLIWRAEPIALQWLHDNTPAVTNAGGNPLTATALGVKDLVGWLESKGLLTIITAMIAIGKALSRGLRAFASDPASLLAADAAGTSTKALRAQTSFRQEFAAEFAEVTWALGKRRRMLILIDDLDRCRPEKVREVLEAVNFLVSSGDCFIVLGMAREIVEHCVGLSFQSVVDTMPWHSFDIGGDDIARTLDDIADGVTKDVPKDIAAKRRAFARLFLDKLIQIELSLPEPTPLQKRRLFDDTHAHGPGDAERERRIERWLGVGRKTTRVAAPILQTAVVTAILMGIALQVGRLVAPASGAPTVSASTAPEEPAPAVDTTVKEPAAKTPPTPPGGPVPQIAPGSRASVGWLAAWPFYLSAFVLALLVLGAIGEVPQAVVRDEKPFRDALRVWHPLVLTSGAHNTPRTARRFQNRVRYLAMRQRALAMEPPMSRAESWLRGFLKTPARRPEPPARLSATIAVTEADLGQIETMLELGVEGPVSIGVVKQTPQGPIVEPNPGIGLDAAALRTLAIGNIYIPETILVALAAIDEYQRRWIVDRQQFEAVAEGVLPAGTLDEQKLLPLREALRQHEELWANWNNLTHYRRAYLRLCSEVQVGRDAPASVV